MHWAMVKELQEFCKNKKKKQKQMDNTLACTDMWFCLFVFLSEAVTSAKMNTLKVSTEMTFSFTEVWDCTKCLINTPEIQIISVTISTMA